MKTNRLTKQEKKQSASLRKQRKGKRNLWVATDSCCDIRGIEYAL